MADTNEYIGEAYDTLMKLSADEQKRLEYEAREKAIRDYNAGMNYMKKQGVAQGEEKRNRDLIYKWSDKGRTVSEMADLLEMPEEDIRKIQAERPQN